MAIKSILFLVLFLVAVTKITGFEVTKRNDATDIGEEVYVEQEMIKKRGSACPRRKDRYCAARKMNCVLYNGNPKCIK